MPIKTDISWVSTRWPDGYTDLDWREAYAEAEARWLAGYTLWVDPERLDENRYRRCPHGTFIATDTETGQEANYCTVCSLLLVSTPPRLKPYSMPYDHPLRRGLRTFPREGVFYLVPRGTIGRHYYPGDHEICPYEPRWRMRKAEAPGGYRRSGRKDGVAILAFPKKRAYEDDPEGDEAEGEPEGQPGSFATLLRPLENRPDPDAILFQLRWFNPHVVPALSDHTALLEFVSPAQFTRWSDFTERPRPEVELTPSGRVRRKDPTPNLPTDAQKLAEHFSRLKAEGEKNLESYRLRRPRVLYMFTIPPLEGDVERWQKKYWTTRKPGRPLRNPRSWLKTPLSEANKKAVASGYHVHGGSSGGWSAAWRTERKMRDLDARLNLYQWGSHKEIRTVRQMLETTTKNAHTAWIEERWHSGPVCKQQPPHHTTERRYLYPAPGPSMPKPYRKPSPNGSRNGPSAGSMDLPFAYACSPWPAWSRR